MVTFDFGHFLVEIGGRNYRETDFWSRFLRFGEFGEKDKANVGRILSENKSYHLEKTSN